MCIFCICIKFTILYDHNLYSSVFDTSTVGSDSSFTLSTDHLVVTFDGSTGLLQSIRKRDSSGRVVLTYVDFIMYSSPSSGAYLFLPDGTVQVILLYNCCNMKAFVDHTI